MLSDDESLLIVRSQYLTLYLHETDKITRARQKDMYSFWIYVDGTPPLCIEHFRKNNPKAPVAYNNTWNCMYNGGFGYVYK